MILPTQAVILCGGKGTRLKPYTFTNPKPMIDINSRPFLFYLLKQLSDSGVNNFLLLVGYKYKVILDYFKDGSEWGWSIQYHIGDESWDTGKRLYCSSHLQEDEYVLLYSDNFVQHNLESLYAKYKTCRAPLAFHIAPKYEGNIQVSVDEYALAYSDQARSVDWPYVDLGYMIINKEAILCCFEGLSDVNISFSKIIQLLCNRHQIPINIVNDKYHSIGDMRRYLLAREYLSFKPHLLIDRDGIINAKSKAGRYVTRWSEFNFVDDTIFAMQSLSSMGYYFSIITNQAGCSTGDMQLCDLDDIHSRMLERFEGLKIPVLDIFVSTDHWNSNAYMRKPNPGMFFELSHKYLQRLDQTLYIGDDIRDVSAAMAAGCGSVYISPSFQEIEYSFCRQFRSLTDSVPFIHDFMSTRSSVRGYFNS